MRPDFTGNNKERLPYEHYLSIYESADPAEIEARTGLAFDENTRSFELLLMGSRYRVTHPGFDIELLSGQRDVLSDWAPAQILILRYLTAGQFVKSFDGYSAYQDMPWGEVYYRNFNGRCILRLAFTFGARPEKLAESMASIGAKPYKMGDMGYEFEFLKGLFVRIAIWQGDDEFPPSAQILFSDNFRYAFTAEDMAFVGDVFIKVLNF